MNAMAEQFIEACLDVPFIFAHDAASHLCGKDVQSERVIFTLYNHALGTS
jgi:hypothetical protein